LERRVFGSTEASSPLALRIDGQPAITEVNRQHDFLPPLRAPRQIRQNHPGRWIVYLLGQGLGDLAEIKVRRPYVPAGEEFDLSFKFRHPPGAAEEETTAVEALAVTALWLTCAYGGIGARTRRGFGGVQIVRVDGEVRRESGPSLRRPSTLWIRPVGAGTSWRLLSFAFRSEFLPGPNAPSVKLGERELSVSSGDVARLTKQWIEVLSSGDSFVEKTRT